LNEIKAVESKGLYDIWREMILDDDHLEELNELFIGNRVATDNFMHSIIKLINPHNNEYTKS
jgi:hypothetical protein